MLRRLMWGLRNTMQLSNDSCYVIFAPLYIKGMSPRTLQISGGGSVDDTTEDGGQQGGSIQRRFRMRISFWNTVKMDMPLMSETALLEDALGFKEWMKSVRDRLGLTTLGGASLEPLRFDGETDPVWHDVALGVGVAYMNISATYRADMPTIFTLNDDDCQPRILS